MSDAEADAQANTQAIAQGLAYLADLAKFGLVPTLERIEYLLRSLGQPQLKYPVVHVAGTNGKGSTARYIAQILTESGLAVGLFTSPHLEKYNERIMVQGRQISDADLLALIEVMKPLAQAAVAEVGHPTEFEMSTAMAFYHFAQVHVDIAVVEVGMGGLWDSTNVVRPLVSIITPVGMDHMNRLGNTLAEIATQKAGIIKQGCPVVVAPQKDAALASILAVARRQQAPVFHVPAAGEICTAQVEDAQHVDVEIVPHSWGIAGGKFGLRGAGWAWDRLQIRLLGRHQIDNAAVAVTACRVLVQAGLHITPTQVELGLWNTFWPGRLELLEPLELSSGQPKLLLDGAHNAEGAAVLAQALREIFNGRKITLVIGVLAEKPVADELRLLLPLAARVICTAPKHGRTPPLPPAELAKMVAVSVADLGLAPLPVTAEPDSVTAVRTALSGAGEDDVVCVCGSLHLVGEVRSTFGPNRGL